MAIYGRHTAVFCDTDALQVFDLCASTFGPSRRIRGHLCTAVESATALAHRRNVYVIGGTDVTGADVTHVQCYDVDSGRCALVSRMPSPARLMCALPYRNYAILLGKTKAFVLDFNNVSSLSLYVCVVGMVEYSDCMLFE